MPRSAWRLEIVHIAIRLVRAKQFKSLYQRLGGSCGRQRLSGFGREPFSLIGGFREKASP